MANDLRFEHTACGADVPSLNQPTNDHEQISVKQLKEQPRFLLLFLQNRDRLFQNCDTRLQFLVFRGQLLRGAEVHAEQPAI
jgi:hypothetical protein